MYYFDPLSTHWPLATRAEKLRQVWVAIDFKKTEYHLSGYRGRVDAEDLAALLKGQLAGQSYLRVFDAYWFDESGDDWEQQSPKGILKRSAAASGRSSRETPTCGSTRS